MSIKCWQREDFDIWVKELSNEKGYVKQWEKNGIALYKRQMEGFSGIGGSRHKWHGKLPYSTDVCWMTTSTYEPTERTAWDHQMIDYKVLDTIQDKLENYIFWYLTKWPWPMSNRDWVHVGIHYRKQTKDGNQYLTLSRSIEHPLDPKYDSNVRVDTSIWALLYTPKIINGVENTEYSVISQFDPNGWVPDAIVSWGIQSLPVEIERDLKIGCKNTLSSQKSIITFSTPGLNEIQ